MASKTFDTAFKGDTEINDVPCARCKKMALRVIGTSGKDRKTRHIQCFNCMQDYENVNSRADIRYSKERVVKG